MSPTFYSSSVVRYCTKAVTTKGELGGKKALPENVLVKNRKKTRQNKKQVFYKFGSIVSHLNG